MLLKDLEVEVALLKNDAFASGSLKNLRLQWKTFVLFCLFFNCPFLPTNSNTVLCYLAFLSRSFKAPASILNYINSVCNVHLCSGLPFDFHKSFEFNLAVKGLKRTKLHKVNQVLPITPNILFKMASLMDFNYPSDTTYWAVFLLGFFLMARKSNLVPPSQAKFDVKKHLCRGDFIFGDTGLVVMLKWSKTNQFGSKRLAIPLIAISNNPLCPVAALKRMCELIPASPASPAFIIPTKKGLVSLTYSTFTSRLRVLLANCGFDPSIYSGHSFRRGGASWAFEAGVAGELIQLHGDWASDAYLEYLHCNMETKCSVSQKMGEFLVSSAIV